MFYNVTFTDFWTALLPSRKRLAKFIALGSPMTVALQWNHDLFFTDYLAGAVYNDYDSLIAYAPGNRVVFARAVYECLVTTTGNDPLDAIYWFKIQNVFIGLRERALSNSQVMSYESILNRYFQVPASPSPQIYITPGNYVANCFVIGASESESSSIGINELEDLNAIYDVGNYGGIDFTINVPIAIFTALATTLTDRRAIIRSVADTYNLAGRIYDVQSY